MNATPTSTVGTLRAARGGVLVVALSILLAALSVEVPAQADTEASVRQAAKPSKPGHARVPKRVFVVGDSLAVGTRPYLVRSLRGWRVGHSVSISKHAPQGVAELARRGPRGLPPVVVAGLGTNDDPRTVSSFEHSVRKALRSVGKRGCLVWPNIVRPRVAGRSYAGYNGVLRRLAAKRRNLIVFNWARMAARHRHWFGGDGVHPNGTGYAARGRAIGNAVRECRRKLVARGK